MPPSCLSILVCELLFSLHPVGIFCVACFGCCLMSCCALMRRGWLCLSQYRFQLVADCRQRLGQPSVVQADEIQFPQTFLVSCACRILLALCWTLSSFSVFLLKGVCVCGKTKHSISDGSSQGLNKGNNRFHGPAACTAANVRVVAVLTVRVWLQSDDCFKLAEALLPSPILNYPAPSFLFLVVSWHQRPCSPMASQNQIKKLIQVETDQCFLSDQFSVPGDCSKP